MSSVFCISDYQRPGKTQATGTTTKTITTIAQSVWAKKTVHGLGLKRIAREVGISYGEAEDALVEAAMDYANGMYKAGLRYGRTMPHGDRRTA